MIDNFFLNFSKTKKKKQKQKTKTKKTKKPAGKMKNESKRHGCK